MSLKIANIFYMVNANEMSNLVVIDMQVCLMIKYLQDVFTDYRQASPSL